VAILILVNCSFRTENVIGNMYAIISGTGNACVAVMS
jgi:hypothetical protein